MITVKSLKILKALPVRTDLSGDASFAKVEDEDKVYQFKDGEWVEYIPPTGVTMSLLDLNSMAVTQLKPLTKSEITKAKHQLRDFVGKQTDGFFMLLSNELKYYTVFDYTVNLVDKHIPLIEDEVINCAQELGVLKAFAPTDDGAYEMWITKDDRSYPLYFFDYRKGVIQCR